MEERGVKEKKKGRGKYTVSQSFLVQIFLREYEIKRFFLFSNLNCLMYILYLGNFMDLKITKLVVLKLLSICTHTHTHTHTRMLSVASSVC